MRRVRRAAVIGVAVLALAACEGHKTERGRGDAPVGPINNAPADVIEMPNHFPNVAHKCDGHGHRVYVVTDDGAPVVVVSDETCR